MLAVLVASMWAAWVAATSDRVSYRALAWAPLVSVGLGLFVLLRRRWGWSVPAVLAAVFLYIGPALGGVVGIAVFVVGAGLGSLTFTVAMDEVRRISWR